jgi:hypothetical protein
MPVFSTPGSWTRAFSQSASASGVVRDVEMRL